MSFWNNWFRTERADAEPPPAISGFVFEVVTVAGRDALDTLERLRLEGQQAEFSPVILGDKDDTDFLNEQQSFHEKSVLEIISASVRIDVEEFFAARVSEDPEYYSFPDADPPQQELTGEGITSHLDVLSREPKPWIHIGKIPTAETWQIPAYLYYGGWNECPMPEEHVAIWRHWHERYGANIICATHDIIEAYVDSPPASPEDAYALARQQYVYCADIVDQGVETISNLASLLRNGTTWYFWWD